MMKGRVMWDLIQSKIPNSQLHGVRAGITFSSWLSCRRWSVIAEHDLERSGKVVGEGAAVAFIHERQQEGKEQQSEEKEPQGKSQATHPMQQAGLLQQTTNVSTLTVIP